MSIHNLRLHDKIRKKILKFHGDKYLFSRAIRSISKSSNQPFQTSHRCFSSWSLSEFGVTLSGSKFQYLEQIFKVPKMFELLNFNSTLPHYSIYRQMLHKYNHIWCSSGLKEVLGCYHNIKQFSLHFLIYSKPKVTCHFLLMSNFVSALIWL